MSLCRQLMAAAKWHYLARHRQQIEQLYCQRLGLSVRLGPFAGMRHTGESQTSMLLPKLIGSYEQELYGSISRIAASQYVEVLDIGCAEGYYVVGLACLLTGTPVRGYDLVSGVLDNCHRMARLNGVAQQVQTFGACSPEELCSRAEARRVLIVMDCEGCEQYLITTETSSALARADLLVETHESIVPGIFGAVRQLLAATHHITAIKPFKRRAGDYPFLRCMPRWYREYAVQEFRNPQDGWIVALGK